MSLWIADLNSLFIKSHAPMAFDNISGAFLISSAIPAQVTGSALNVFKINLFFLKISLSLVEMNPPFPALTILGEPVDATIMCA